MRKICWELCLFIVVIIPAFMSCTKQIQCEATDAEKKEITAEIETVVKNLWNVEKVSYETNDQLRRGVDGFVMGSDAKIVFKNYEEFDSAMRKSFGSIEKFIEAEIPAIHVYVLAKDAATCTYEFKSRFITMTGDTIVNNGCWTFVFKKLDNAWKVVQENGTHTVN